MADKPTETAAAEQAPTLRVRANANVTLGGVTVYAGDEGDVPDGVETRSAANMGLIDLLDGDETAAESTDDADAGANAAADDEKAKRGRGRGASTE